MALASVWTVCDDLLCACIHACVRGSPRLFVPSFFSLFYPSNCFTLLSLFSFLLFRCPPHLPLSMVSSVFLIARFSSARFFLCLFSPIMFVYLSPSSPLHFLISSESSTVLLRRAISFCYFSTFFSFRRKLLLGPNSALQLHWMADVSGMEMMEAA